MSKSMENLVKEISGLTVLELAELTKALNQHLVFLLQCQWQLQHLLLKLQQLAKQRRRKN